MQGGDKTVGMFCHEFWGWEREVEIVMCDKCVEELVNKGVNKNFKVVISDTYTSVKETSKVIWQKDGSYLR